MNSETSHKPPYAQPRLFGPESTTTGIAELFPAIWNAAEDLSNPIPSVRQLALECLIHPRRCRTHYRSGGDHRRCRRLLRPAP